MFYTKFGHGDKNLIIIAGVSLCGLQGQEAAIANAYQLFAEEYTVYLCERKSVLPEGYQVEDMAEDVYQAMLAEGVSKADLYGVSQGGMIALCLAVTHPEFVNKMVLCSSQCKATPLMKKNAEVWVQLAEQKNVVALNRYFFDVVYSPAFLESVKEMLPVLEKQGSEDDCTRFVVLAKACATFDISDKMNLIKCPVLVIGDKNDKTIGPEGSYEIAEKLNCDIFMYDQYSHAVYDEAPDIKKRIKSFLLG